MAEALGRELGAEQTVAGVDALSAVGEMTFGASRLKPVPIAERPGPSWRSCSQSTTSIYETNDEATTTAADPIEALDKEGLVAVDDGRRFVVRHGKLDTGGTSDGVWRIATKAIDSWLAKVEHRRWRTFGGIGKVRAGVKTCADGVFIRDDWHTMSECGRPELLCPLATHHIARQYKALPTKRPREILYPHEILKSAAGPWT